MSNTPATQTPETTEGSAGVGDVATPFNSAETEFLSKATALQQEITYKYVATSAIVSAAPVVCLLFVFGIIALYWRWRFVTYVAGLLAFAIMGIKVGCLLPLVAPSGSAWLLLFGVPGVTIVCGLGIIVCIGGIVSDLYRLFFRQKTS